MQPFVAPILWAFFFALPCALIAILGANLSTTRLRTPVGAGRRWVLARRVAAFFVLAVVAFVVLLVGCVFVPMHLGL